VVNQSKSNRRRAALLSTLLSQVSKSPELAKIMLLLLVWGNVRSRSGYTMLEVRPALKPSRDNIAPKRRGFTVKLPRERFL
jgi:hypothetical protein